MDEAGVTHCQIFESDKEGKMATGTDFSFQLGENCEAVMIGNHDILDKDEERVNSIINRRKKACRKGL